MGSRIAKQSLILFQGDSITDAGRNREETKDLGRGYALMTAATLSAKHPDRQYSFLNRGVSGDRTVNLRERWQKDCIDLRPDWVSILIGVNDTWRRYSENNPTSTDEYEELYRGLLSSVKEKLGAGIILIEPFLLPNHPEYQRWREDLDPKIQVVRKLSREFQTIYVPTDGLFAQACANTDPDYWSHDGVHASPAGHALISEAWMKAAGFQP